MVLDKTLEKEQAIKSKFKSPISSHSDKSSTTIPNLARWMSVYTRPYLIRVNVVVGIMFNNFSSRTKKFVHTAAGYEKIYVRVNLSWGVVDCSFVIFKTTKQCPE